MAKLLDYLNQAGNAFYGWSRDRRADNERRARMSLDNLRMEIEKEKLNDMRRKATMEEWTRQALAAVKPYEEFQRPSTAVAGNEDVPDTGSMVTERTQLPLPQYMRNLGTALVQRDPRGAIPYFKEATDMEEKIEDRKYKRESDPVVPFDFQGTKGTAAISKVAPIAGREDALAERKQAREEMSQYRRDLMDQNDRHHKENLAVRREKSNTTPTSNQVDILARGILDGTIDPNGISKRGGLQAGVWSRVKELDPAFNIVKAGAGAKFEGSTATMQTKALLNAIDPLLNKLQEAGNILNNSDLPAFNRAANFLKEQTGDPSIVGFNNLRDDVVAEVERGLLGTGVLSDSKYLRAVKNINSAQTVPQLKAAIANTRIVIKARLEALEAGPYKNQKPTGEKPAAKPLSWEELKKQKGW